MHERNLTAVFLLSIKLVLTSLKKKEKKVKNTCYRRASYQYNQQQQ